MAIAAICSLSIGVVATARARLFYIRPQYHGCRLRFSVNSLIVPCCQHCGVGAFVPESVQLNVIFEGLPVFGF